jgi:dipeptidase D
MLKLNPECLWNHFEAMSRIPRASGNETGVAEFIRVWAKKKGFAVETDAVGNVLVRVPASKGHEKAKVVVLQGHMDMVCEKDRHTQHDFTKDPLRLKIVGPNLYADGTTLGADNGIGAAAGMWAAEDPACIHGPLELLFTVDEETGLKGANGLRPGWLKGAYLLNLDTEEEGFLYIGCAGGQDTSLTLRVTREKAPNRNPALEIHVKGLQGGHSGGDIHEGRGNANRLLVRVLEEMRRNEIPFALVSLEGGSKRNAIPREASAHLHLAPKAAQAAQKVCAAMQAEFREELKGLDDGVLIELHSAKKGLPPLTEKSAAKVLDLLGSIPHGVLGMSRDIPGLVETSTNFAIVGTEKASVTVWTSQRSSVASRRTEAVRMLAALGQLAGAKVVHSDGYPGWKPQPDAALLRICKEVYKKVTGAEAEVKAIHAGLECGLIGEKFPAMQMISMGPTIRNAHSPTEYVEIASVGRFYDYLKAVLKEMA